MTAAILWPLERCLGIILPPSIWLSGFALCALISLAIYRTILHPLASWPGPLEARIAGTWRNRRFWRGSWHDDIVEAHKRWGPVVRIAPNELSVVDEATSRLLFGHGTRALKTDWYKTWDDPIGGTSSFSTTDRNVHSYLRKRVSNVYSMSAMLRYEEIMQSSLNLMISKLKKYADAGNTVNMSDWTEMLAYDIVGDLTYGSPLGQLETETDTLNIRSTIHAGFVMLSNMGHYPGQSQWIRRPSVGRMLSVFGVQDHFTPFRDWTLQRIRYRQQNENQTQREDMLYHFLRMKTASGNPPSEIEITTEAAIIIGAGADTTSIAMRSCLFYLCKHRAAYAKVQNEIDSYHKSQNLQRPITYQQTLELPFFCAVVKESLRLFPSIVYPLLRYALPGMEVDGKVIPVGTPVGVSPIAANRNPKIYGPDADEFKPERWLESEEKTRLFNANDMTWGGNGPRTCIGKNLAMVELHKFLAQLLHHFDVELANPDKPWRIASAWFANQYDMHMRLKCRVGA